MSWYSPRRRIPELLALCSALYLGGCDISPTGSASSDGGSKDGGGSAGSKDAGGGGGGGGGGSNDGGGGGGGGGGSNDGGGGGGGGGSNDAGGGGGGSNDGGGGGSNGDDGGGLTGTVFRVNGDGRITKNGTVFPVHCGSWFGLQGRYEPSTGGAPMELYIGNTSWASDHSRTVESDMDQMTAKGINLVRMPVVHQTLDPNDPMGKAPNLKNYVQQTNALQALKDWITAAAKHNIYVLLDIHSCSNYVDWRKGRLDARPPWVDDTRDSYTYTRTTYSCAADKNPSTVTSDHIQAYNEQIWLQDLKTLAELGKQLGVDNILGIDIFNEPWDYSWDEWKSLAEDAYQAINEVNPNILVFVQGISNSHGNQSGDPSTVGPTPYGDTDVNPNWGENLFGVGTKGSGAPSIPKSRIVFSPHTYGPSVAVQRQFLKADQNGTLTGKPCNLLEGDDAGNNKCDMVINADMLKRGWEQHFGYLKGLGYAVVVGEFGGNMEWPGGKASKRDQDRYKYLIDKGNTSSDSQWQNAFVDYMVSKKIEACYWSINPESGDTGGWYGTNYDPLNDTTDWGTWTDFQPTRTTLLKRLWDGIPPPPSP